MRSFVKRTLSVVTAAALLSPFISSCGKDPGETSPGVTPVEGQSMPSSGQEIGEQSVWYDVSRIDLRGKYEDEEYDSFNINYIGVENDRIAVYVMASYDIPQGLDCLRDDLSMYRNESIDIYDMGGELINSIDVQDLFNTLPGASGNYAYVIDYSFDEGRIRTMVSAFDPDDESFSVHCFTVDPDTGDIISDVVTGDDGAPAERRYDLGEYNVEQYFSWGDDFSSYSLKILPDSGEPFDIQLNAKLPGQDIFDISNIVLVSEDMALCSYTTSENVPGFISVDLQSGACSICDEDMSWLGEQGIIGAVNTDEGTVVRIEADGVYELDFESHSVVSVLDFNNSNVNRYQASGFLLMDIDNGKYIFLSRLDVGSDWHEYLNVFTRSESNPNAGKTILRAAAPGGLTYAVAEAVARFNDESSDGFIIFDDSYSTFQAPAVYPHGIYTEPDDIDELELRSSVSNALAIDLMTGEGPDIIFGTIGYSQFNSSDYLVDLSDLLPSEGYFDNVMDAARTEDALYQIPLDCGFSGITASGDDVGYDSYGFTFDAYPGFVDEVCNGDDPIGLDRDDYIVLLYSAMNDCFTDDAGHVDYDNGYFRALAEFAYNIPETGSNHDECDICGRVNIGVGYVTINSLSEYLSTFGGSSSSTRLMGIPSYDGRGPVINVPDSVGISSNAADIGICEEFVEYLLSYDAQTVFAFAGYTPVNIAAFEDGSQDVIDQYNEQVEYLLQFETRDELARCGFFADTVDRSVIDAYEGFITSSHTISMSDPSVLMIVREEMPAYFSGQKSLDEVIEIMQDRVQTYINERG